MPKLYDKTYGVTEDELIQAAIDNSWTVGDVLSAYTGQVKLFRIFEELNDNGDIEIWSRDCHYSEQSMNDLLMDSLDDKANLKVYGHLRGVEVRCTMTLKEGSRIYLYLPIANTNESYMKLESRVRRLERLIRL